jgi:hypothetical protein
MTTSTPAAARPSSDRPLVGRARLAAIGLLAALVLTACGEAPGSRSPAASGAPGSGLATASASLVPTPTPTPSPTPMPTPQFTNPADDELTALIPAEVAGVTVRVPPVEEFAYTPGDIAEAYGELGLRFTALQVAYVDQPRLSLFAMRVDGEPVTTEDLEPHLATAGRYVGIAGLVRDPWELVTIGDRLAWVRPEDNATAAGTMIYTWAAEEFVFLMIGVDDAVNRALFAALPGEAAPTPTPRPSRSPRSTRSVAPSPSASAS